MVDAIEKIANLAMDQLDKTNAANPLVHKLSHITESFLRSKRMLGYGGTAINNLLPNSAQFYDPKYDIPDYDFYSETPQLHAAELADKLASIPGVNEVEVRPAAHLGTFKVYADYIQVADISHLESELFKNLWKARVIKDGVSYVPPNFLKMGVYLELSRPFGKDANAERWPKIYARLLLLNEHYPMKECPVDPLEKISTEQRKEIESFLIKKKAIILGFNATSLHQRKSEWHFPLDIMVEAKDRESVSKELAVMLKGNIKDHENYAFVLPAHTDVERGSGASKSLVRVYEPVYCHSYHKTASGLRIASIPAILQFFLSMLYGNAHIQEHVSEERLICVAEHLMEMAHNSTRRYKILTPLECTGNQQSAIDIKKERSELYKKLKGNKSSPEYIEKFFTYKPTELTKTKRNKVKSLLKKTLKNRLK